jgi:hypothetical protein
MVDFGKLLKRSRRGGWETAYLDYNKLKRILSSLANSRMDRNDGTEVDNSQNNGEIVRSYEDETEKCSIRIKEAFFQELGEEIEKVSLFTLKMQGILSEAIGYLRFRDDDTINVVKLFSNEVSIFRRFNTEKNRNLMKDDIEMYLILGVELLFLIQFVGVNTLALRKVLKKYNKIIRRLNKPEYYYVMGGKDDFHLHQIANSQSLSAIHSSLQSALVKFYLNDKLLTTESERELKLFRFQSIIQASYVIRENSEVVNQPFKDFLSRKAMINTGSSLGGIEGSEMRAMNEVLNFSPIAMLTCNIEELDLMWTRWIPQYEAWKNEQSVYKDTPLRLKDITIYAMEVLEDEEIDWHALSRKGSLLHESKSKEYGFEEKAWGGMDMPSMILNLLSILLYTVNYYIIAPTANHYAVVLGKDGAYGATLIGTSSFSAIIAAVLYSFWYTNSSFKSALLFSTLCPICGNLMYGLAVSYDSMALAIIGRFLCGFGSAEVINRQLISTCVSFAQITRASAFFVAASAMGMSIGPLIAAILDDTTGRDLLVDLHLPFNPAGGIIFNSVTSPGFLMAILWFLEFLLLLFFFSEPDRINGTGVSNKKTNIDTETSFLIETDYGSMEERRMPNDSTSNQNPEEASDSDSVTVSMSPEFQKPVGGFWGEAMSACSLLLINQGLPVTLLLFCYIELADEVLIASCSMVVRRYFDRNASAAGYLVAR